MVVMSSGIAFQIVDPKQWNRLVTGASEIMFEILGALVL
jgi:hypothetical protein